jgi:protein tyrosine/serine phosphatase
MPGPGCGGSGDLVVKLVSAETRQARRARRRARNLKPIEGLGRRLGLWLNALFVDHQILRWFFLNRHRLGREAWRSAQPSPGQIRWFVRQGVRTVVNLRGESEFGTYPLEREACERAKVAYVEAKLRSRELPSRGALLEIAAMLDRIAYPALFHCKSGADRAGLMSALYLMLREGAGPEDARRQLSLRYLHFAGSRTGILGHMIDAYAADRRAAAARGQALAFLCWVRTVYDPAAIAASFHSTRTQRFISDWLLRRE